MFFGYRKSALFRRCIHLPITILLTFAVVHHLRSQESAFTRPWITYDSQDGLAVSGVSALAQDSHGLLWIGTPEGIIRFDGAIFRRFTSRDGMPSNVFQTLCMSPREEGVVYAGTRNGIVRCSGSNVTSIPQQPVESMANVTRLCVDNSGRMWCGTTGGIGIVDGPTVRPVAGASAGMILDMAVMKNGQVYASGFEGLITVRPGSGVAVRCQLPIPSGYAPWSLAPDGAGGVWVAVDDSSLYHVMDTVVLSRHRLPAKWVTGLVNNGDGSLYAFASTGMFKVRPESPGSTIRVSTDARAPVLIDREGNLWAASARPGVMMLPRFAPAVFPDTADGDGPQPMVKDRHGNVWCLNRSGVSEYSVDVRNTWSRTAHTRPFKGRPHWLAMDSTGLMWVSLADPPVLSAYRIQAGVAGATDLVPVREFQLDRSPANFHIDRHNTLWLTFNGSSGPTVVHLNPVTGQVLGSGSPPSPDFGSRCALTTGKGELLIGEFDNGLFLSRPNDLSRWDSLTMTSGLPDDHIRSLCIDNRGRLVIGTRYGGLAVREGGRTLIYEMEQGLPSNWVKSLLVDHEGGVVIGTDAGIAVLGDGVSPSVTAFPLFRGERVGGMIEGDGGWLVVRTTVSVMCYDLQGERRQRIASTVRIEDVELSGERVDIGTGGTFPHERNLLAVKFGGVHFADPQSVRFLYRLEGVDREWIGPTDRKSVSYAGLQSGSYRFFLKSVGWNELVSPAAAVVEFTIEPALWERWWFRGGILLCVIVLAGTIYSRRVSFLKKERTIKEEFARQLLASQEAERKRIATELHDGLGQELLIIRNKALLGIQASEPAEREKFLEEISDTVTESLDAASEMAYNLHPFQLDRLGLTKAIVALIHRAETSSTIAFSHSVDNIDGLLPKPHEINLYRILQESMNNILKHSGATSVAVTIHRNGRRISISVEDNGKGFDVEEKRRLRDHGLGLAGLYERARIIGGTLDIHSGPGTGTRLSLDIIVKGE